MAKKELIYSAIIPITDYQKLSDESKKKFREVLIEIDKNRESVKKKPLSQNSYIVCNEDEPYADMVLGVILFGETLKEQIRVDKAEDGDDDIGEENLGL